MDTIISNSHGERLDYTFHDPGKKSLDILIIGHGVTGNKDRPFIVALAEAIAEGGNGNLEIFIFWEWFIGRRFS